MAVGFGGETGVVVEGAGDSPGITSGVGIAVGFNVTGDEVDVVVEGR